jgi:hypothetical protein
MDKICTQCGKHLQADQGFCDECGTPWTAPAGTASAPVAAPPPAPQETYTPPPAEAGTGSHKVLIGVIVAFVVLAALIGGGWWWMSRKSAGNATLAPPEAKSPTSTSATASQVSPDATATAPPGTSSVSDALATTATTSSAAAAASRPCSLVSQADLEQILGVKIVNITSNETSCEYFTDASLSAQIETTWTGGKDAMTAAKGYNANPGLFEPVAGIGDEAYTQAAGVLHVLKGDVYLVINAREYPNHEQTELAIARKAMEKLN